MSVYIAVKAFRLLILVVIVFEFFNIHRCFSSTTSRSYSCLTDIITTFHFLSVSGATIGGYHNIVLIILLLTFFFNKKMAYIYIICFSFYIQYFELYYKVHYIFLPCLNISTFHLLFAVWLFSPNTVLISITKLF